MYAPRYCTPNTRTVPRPPPDRRTRRHRAVENLRRRSERRTIALEISRQQRNKPLIVQALCNHVKIPSSTHVLIVIPRAHDHRDPTSARTSSTDARVSGRTSRLSNKSPGRNTASASPVETCDSACWNESFASVARCGTRYCCRPRWDVRQMEESRHTYSTSRMGYKPILGAVKVKLTPQSKYATVEVKSQTTPSKSILTYLIQYR